MNLIDLSYLKTSFDLWLEKSDELILDMGGVSLFEVLGKKEVDFDAKSVQPNLKDRLGKQYLHVAAMFERRKKYKDDLKLCIFVREKFPKLNYDIPDAIATSIFHQKKIYKKSGFPGDAGPPTIRQINPKKGIRTENKRPTIEVKLHDGDISQFQIDMSRLVFTLDGEDITDEMKVKTCINKSGKLGQIFEEIKIKYQPDAPLSPGKHNVYIKATDYGDHVVEKSWSFTIKE